MSHTPPRAGMGNKGSCAAAKPRSTPEPAEPPAVVPPAYTAPAPAVAKDMIHGSRYSPFTSIHRWLGTGIEYRGALVHGVPEGNGTYWADGVKRLESVFVNGQPGGVVTMYYPSGGLLYKGTIQADFRFAEGELFYPGGSPWFVGEFVHNTGYDRGFVRGKLWHYNEPGDVDGATPALEYDGTFGMQYGTHTQFHTGTRWHPNGVVWYQGVFPRDITDFRTYVISGDGDAEQAMVSYRENGEVHISVTGTSALMKIKTFDRDGRMVYDVTSTAGVIRRRDNRNQEVTYQGYMVRGFKHVYTNDCYQLFKLSYDQVGDRPTTEQLSPVAAPVRLASLPDYPAAAAGAADEVKS